MNRRRTQAPKRSAKSSSSDLEQEPRNGEVADGAAEERSEHVAVLERGREVWNSWRAANPHIRPNLGGAVLFQKDLSGFDLRGADLYHANLLGANLENADLSPMCLIRTLEGQLVDIRLGGVGAAEAMADLLPALAHDRDASTSWSSGSRATYLTDLRSVEAMGANFERANMARVVLTRGFLMDANLRGVNLEGALLSRTDMTRAALTGAFFRNAYLSATDLDGVSFGTDHDALEDGTDALILPRRERLLNWSRLRTIGNFPLFSVSWTSLALAVLVINAIGYANDHANRLLDRAVNLPIPDRMTWLLVSSILLVVGSTAYRLYCPRRIQEFSEADWVDRHRYPRLQYYAKSWRRRGQWFVLLTTGFGGLLALGLIVERALVALRYSFAQLGLFG